MNPARADVHRTRFRRPLGVAVMAYKAILGLSEIVVGVLLAVPTFDPRATFARLSAEELREDPGDRFVALVSRHSSATIAETRTAFSHSRRVPRAITDDAPPLAHPEPKIIRGE
jgi:uncharacterized membrane protein